MSHTPTMSIELWWPKLKLTTREWLIENNGDEVPLEVVSEIAEAGGPAPSDPWWASESAPGFHAPDEATDWIEAIANSEEGES